MASLDLRRLKALHGETPKTLIARIRLAWPEIKIALDQGHSLRDVHERLTEAGIGISYRRLSEYVIRLRREEKGSRTPRARAGKIAEQSADSEIVGDVVDSRNVRNPGKVNALADFRERTAKVRRFEFKPGPPDESKLI